MSFFQPLDSKHTDGAADSNPLFLTLDEPAPFRAFEPALEPVVPGSAADTLFHAQQPVFRSVGPMSLAMPSFSSTSSRATYSGSEEDEESAPAPADATTEMWNATSASAASAALSGASAVMSLKSLSLPSVVSNAAEVCEAPAYYERHSSFLSRAAPSDILLALAAALESQLIEFQLSPNQHKIRGVVLANSVASHFVIRVWRQTAAHAYLVEFQRRSGCVVVFTNFYRACTAAISHMIVGSVAAPAVATASVPFEVTLHASEPKAVPSTAGAGGCGSVTLDDASFRALTDMACSGDAVSATEAMRVLGRAVASSPVNQRFVADQSPKRNNSQRTLDSLNATARSTNSYLQMLAAQLASALVATVASSSSSSSSSSDSPLRQALLKLLPRSASSSSSDLLSRETARLVRRCTDPTGASSASDKLALPAPSAHSKLSVPAFASTLSSLSSFHALNESTYE